MNNKLKNNINNNNEDGEIFLQRKTYVTTNSKTKSFNSSKNDIDLPTSNKADMTSDSRLKDTQLSNQLRGDSDFQNRNTALEGAKRYDKPVSNNPFRKSSDDDWTSKTDLNSMDMKDGIVPDTIDSNKGVKNADNVLSNINGGNNFSKNNNTNSKDGLSDRFNSLRGNNNFNGFDKNDNLSNDNSSSSGSNLDNKPGINDIGKSGDSKNKPNANNNVNNLQNKAAKEALKKGAVAANPALGAIANTKVGDKLMDAALNKAKNRKMPFFNPMGFGNKQKEKNKAPEHVVVDWIGHLPIQVKIGVPIAIVFFIIVVVCILMVSSYMQHILNFVDLSGSMSLDDAEIQSKLIDANDDSVDDGSGSNSSAHSTSSGASGSNQTSVSEPLSPTGIATVDKLNKIALEQVSNTGDKYESWYGTYADWCAIFVSWLFDQVGGLNKYIVKASGAGDIPRYSVSAGYGVWYDDECTESSTVPRAGDIILFDPYVGGGYVSYPNHGGDKYYSSHVGYVYKVDDKYVYTVEGNTSGNSSGGGYNGVWKLQYERNYCGPGGGQRINGYFRPNY